MEMIRRRRGPAGRLLALALLAVALTPAVGQQAEVAGATQHTVHFELELDGRRLGTPTLIVADGVRAQIEVPGAQGYRLSTTVRRAARENEPVFQLENEVAVPDASGYRPIGRPVLTVSAGYPVVFETWGADGTDRLRIVATVEPDASTP